MAKYVVGRGQVVQDPPLVKTLLRSPAAAWLWLPLRLWLGWRWIDAASHKIENPAWTQTGVALKGFWSNIVVIPAEGR
ncbi:MAG: DoxX family protein, partial [Anaerolineales bacterium]